MNKETRELGRSVSIETTTKPCEKIIVPSNQRKNIIIEWPDGVRETYWSSVYGWSMLAFGLGIILGFFVLKGGIL